MVNVCDCISFLELDHNQFFPKDDSLKFVSFLNILRKTIRESAMPESYKLNMLVQTCMKRV